LGNIIGESELLDKILFATDGSDSSLVAEKLAAFVAKKFKSKVTVLHATFSTSFETIGLPLTRPVKEGRIYLSPRTPEPFEEISESLRQRGTVLVANAVALFKEQGIEVDQKIESDEATEAILKEAESGSYGLIIMGASGKMTRKPHLGYITKKAALNAKSSVLIARQLEISKILVPVDGSEDSLKAFEHAVALAKEMDTKITLINVMDSNFFRVKPEFNKEIGKKILSQAADKAEGVKHIKD
jgi:nucleotide-binding universal stress UspA family protein